VLEGVVPFPPEFAKRYREKGYWIDKSLAQEYRIAFDKFEKRVALLDRDRSITYGELDRMSDNLALNLLEIGFHSLDRVVVQLPNVAEFVVLYLALQKIGCIPIAALMPHRFAEISQFVELRARRLAWFRTSKAILTIAPWSTAFAKKFPSCAMGSSLDLLVRAFYRFPI